MKEEEDEGLDQDIKEHFKRMKDFKGIDKDDFKKRFEEDQSS